MPISAWNLKIFGSKYLHLMCFEWTICRLFQICLSFFQIQDLGQSRSKSAFSFLFPSVLLSCQHYLKAIFRIILPSHFFAFSNGVEQKSLFCWSTCGKCGGKLENSIFSTKIESFQVNWNWQPKQFCTKKAKTNPLHQAKEDT